RYRYSGSSTGVSLRSWDIPVSFASQDEGSLGDQQWFLNAGHVQGVGSGRDIFESIFIICFLLLYFVYFSSFYFPFFLLVYFSSFFDSLSYF
ncbi:hypothetical protein MTR67_040146, partial [Solanum verrucosum]